MHALKNNTITTKIFLFLIFSHFAKSHEHSPLELDGADHHSDQIEAVINKPVKEMTKEEKQVNWFKTNDYDNNDKIDGLEIIQSMIQHEISSKKDGGSEYRGFQDLDEGQYIMVVEEWLKNQDINNDGFVDFPEWKLAHDKNK